MTVNIDYYNEENNRYDPDCYQCRMDKNKYHANVPPAQLCIGHIIKRLRIAEGAKQLLRPDSPESSHS
jgi:hypothetical protein